MWPAQAHLRHLASDASAAASYFAWRQAPRDTPEARRNFQRTLDMTAYKYTALCRICAKLDRDKPTNSGLTAKAG